MDQELKTKLESALQLGNKKYYEEFDTSIYGNSLEAGSMPADALYEHWIQKYKPELAIEVGSFLGYSAIKMAKEVKRLNLSTKIICVDTWLGSPEHYDMHKGEMKDNRLGYVNGYPSMYYKFISNVIQNDVQDIINPLPYPSSIAIKVLHKILTPLKIKPEFIFVDGSHEEYDVFFDCYNYYPLLKVGGALWGDDWGWEGVRNGVNRFCEDNDLKVNVLDNKVHWYINKDKEV
jgi:predicted O-methyltransferase YrrM